MKTRLRWVLIVLILAGLGLLLWPRQSSPALPVLPGFAMTPDADFAHATAPAPFSFPADFGAHPDYQTEWWYYTGNLQAANGDHFGFQLTFFRRALLPRSRQPERASDWAANQVYMAHFALTGVRDNSFRYYERLSRGAAGLAGAAGLPEYKVWLEDWQVVQTGVNTYHLTAAQDGIMLDLNFKDTVGPVLQGDRGLSQKGPEPGNASFYFSQPALQTSGKIQLGNQAIAVTGQSWMDHEFGTSALGADEVGWDWFALQLDDGSELMIYSLRHKDGVIDPYSRGTLIHADGTTAQLSRQDFKITNEATWKSPASGAVYPAQWTVEIPAANLILRVKPYVADQELRLSFTYWEGAVQVSGMQNGRVISGNGYVELTGYYQSMAGQF